MIAVVAPEPAAWLSPLLARLERPVEVFAPWAAPGWALRVPGERVGGRVGERIGDALARRGGPEGAARVPGWIAVEAATAGWIAAAPDAGAREARRIAARLGAREVADRLAAAWLPGGTTVVIAPTLAARRTFAAARARGAATWLVQDLPGLRDLAADLDRAARAHPGWPLLRNYRAPWRQVARQEAEWALADRAFVRSAHAAARLPVPGCEPLPGAPPLCGAPLDGAPLDGAPPDRSPSAGAPLDGAFPCAPLREPDPRGRPLHVLLAGPPAARAGAWEAAEACARVGAILFVRAGTGPEAAALAAHPAVRPAGADPIDLVVAPAWVECDPPEVAAARVPVVATARAAGWARHVPVEPGDVAGLAAAIRRYESATATPAICAARVGESSVMARTKLGWVAPDTRNVHR